MCCVANFYSAGVVTHYPTILRELGPDWAIFRPSGNVFALGRFFFKIKKWPNFWATFSMVNAINKF
jgi:hypothetical protein